MSGPGERSPGPVPPSAKEPLGPADRLVVFTDAVVAIALTLLVLPLVDLVPEGRRAGLTLGELLLESRDRLGSFLLSFLVIFRFWWAHHQLFRHIALLQRALVSWTMLWTLSIVFLPVPTAIITAYEPSPGSVALYIGTLLVTSGSLTLLALTAYRHPEVSAGRTLQTRDELLGNVVTTGTLLAALVLGTVFAHTVNYFALLLMLASGAVEGLVRRRWARGSRSAAGTG